MAQVTLTTIQHFPERKRTGKLLVIQSCKECWRCREYHGSCVFYCTDEDRNFQRDKLGRLRRKLGEYGKNEYDFEMPKWCPLKDSQ